MKMVNLRKFASIALALLLPALSVGQTETKLNNFGSSPVFLLTTPYTNGQCLVYSTSSLAWINTSCGGGGSGTVTSVALSIPSLFTISGSPVTTTGTLTATPAGTSGGIPYFNSATSLASSAALTANALLLGGGAGGTPTNVGSLGTTTTVLHGNAAGAPTFGAVALGSDVSGTLGVTNGGNGLATATLGDIRYGSGTNTLAALPGNTSATKNFFTQTGTGAVSAAPAWSTIATADIATALTTPGPIGATTASTGAFTTLSASSTVSGTGFSTYLASPPPIGGTAAAAASFTTISATGLQTINLTGQTANTNAVAQLLENTTPATSGNQQNACSRLDGQGFASTPAASQPVSWLMCNLPAQAAANPTSSLAYLTSINGGAYSSVFTLANTGGVNLAGSLTTASAVNGGRIVATGSTIAANGLYLPSANTLGFAANTTAVGSWTTTAFSALNGVLIPGIASSTAAQTGTLCWTTGTGNVTEDPSSTCLVSARRFKDHIEPLDTGLAEVLRLQPVRYHLKEAVAASIDDPSNYAYGEQVGFIAEDVAGVDQRLVTYEADGQAHSVRYLQMTALLAHALQEEHARVGAQLERQQLQIYMLAAWCLLLTVIVLFFLLRRHRFRS